MADPPQQGTQSVGMQVSNEMVRIYKEQFGRGPTKASTIVSENVVLCTLEDSLTRAEKSLVEMGEYQRLRDVRLFFQYASEKEFKEAVEGITGRKVRAFVSGIDAGRDVSSEVFYLEPEGSAA